MSYSRALTHNASKDIPENESPNTDPQNDVDSDRDRVCHLDEIFQDVIPVIQREELEQSNKCITQGTVLTELESWVFVNFALLCSHSFTDNGP